MWKYNIVILFFLMASCQSPQSNLLANKLEINSDSCCVVIKNIHPEILEQLTSDSLTTQQWQSNIAIYPKATEDDLQDLEAPLAGDYAIQNNELIFKPDTAFKKGEYYLLELYLQNPDGNLLEKLKGESSPFNQKPIRKTLKF